MMANNAYKHIFKAMVLFSGVQGLNILLNILRAKLAAVLLGTTGVGLNGIYNETRELLHETTSIGLDKSGVREIARAYGEKDSEEGEKRLRDAISLTRSWILLLSLFGTLLMLMLAQPLSLLTFSNLDHVWGYAILAPSVGFTTMSCGELVVLRGIQKLKSIAMVSMLHVMVGIMTTIPVYYVWGIKGVAVALLLMTFAMMVVSMVCSYRYYKPEFCFSRKFLAGGRAMLGIGLSFVLAGFVGHGAKLAVQSILNNIGSLEIVGLYNAGFAISMTYISTIFTSLDTDYFPRLSNVFDNKAERSMTVLRQMEVTLSVTLPIIAIAIFAMPIIVPLFLTKEFCAIIPMAQIALTSYIFRSIYLPSALMPIAAGHSRLFFFMELASYIFFIPALILGYRYFGITGLGWGIFANNLFDVIIGVGCAKVFYGLNINFKILVRMVIFFVITMFCYILAANTDGITYWLCATGMTAICLLIGGKEILLRIKK